MPIYIFLNSGFNRDQGSKPNTSKQVKILFNAEFDLRLKVLKTSFISKILTLYHSNMNWLLIILILKRLRGENSVLWNNRFIGQKPNSLHLHILFLGSSMVVRPLEFDIIVCFLNFCCLLVFFFCCLLCISNVQFNSGLTIRVWHFVSLVFL